MPVSLGSPRFSTVEVDGFWVSEVWFPPRLRLPTHRHDRACFAVMLEGSFDLQLPNLTKGCPPASVFTEPIGEVHGNRVERAGAHVLVVQPDPGRADLLGPCAPVLDRVTHVRHGGIASLGWRLAREIQAPDAVSSLAIEGLVLQMLSASARLNDPERAGRRPPPWLLRARDLLHARFLERLRVGDIAAEAGVHPVHLARVFRAHNGVSIGAYVRTLRLDWAAARLARTEEPLSDIALEAGFADQSHFTRTFRRHTGSTPLQFRRAARAAG